MDKGKLQNAFAATMFIFLLTVLIIGCRRETPIEAPSREVASRKAHAPEQIVVKSALQDASKSADIYDEPLVRQATSVSNLSGRTGDGLAALLNINGELCAEVISAKPTKQAHIYDVRCQTSRNGEGVSHYSFDAREGDARLVSRRS